MLTRDLQYLTRLISVKFRKELADMKICLTKSLKCGKMIRVGASILIGKRSREAVYADVAE